MISRNLITRSAGLMAGSILTTSFTFTVIDQQERRTLIELKMYGCLFYNDVWEELGRLIEGA